MEEAHGSLPDTQLEVMQVLWAGGGSMMFAELAQALQRRGRGWKANTVLTLLARLTERGMVAAEKEGRLNRYVALLNENDYLEGQTRRFVDRVYGGDVKHLMAALLRQNTLSKEDCDELRLFWEGKKGAS